MKICKVLYTSLALETYDSTKVVRSLRERLERVDREEGWTAVEFSWACTGGPLMKQETRAEKAISLHSKPALSLPSPLHDDVPHRRQRGCRRRRATRRPAMARLLKGICVLVRAWPHDIRRRTHLHVRAETDPNSRRSFATTATYQIGETKGEPRRQRRTRTGRQRRQGTDANT